MARTIFVQSSKLNNVRGRISYISSPARQENLYAVYETTEEISGPDLQEKMKTVLS